MSFSSGSQLRAIVDQLLTGVATGYFPQGMIADQILPEVKSKNYTGKIGKFGSSHLRIVSTVVAGKGKYRQIEGVARDSDSFHIKGHGLTDLVTREDYANVIEPFKAESDSVLVLKTLLALEKEKAIADVLGSTSTITQNTTLTGTSQYNDYLSSDPIGDFSTARAAVYDGCGTQPNTAIMSWKVFDKLRFHPSLLVALGYRYDRPGALNEQELCAALSVKKLLIGDAKYNSAAEGQADVLTDVWGKNMLFAVCPDRLDVPQVTLGYTVRLDGSTPQKVYKTPVNNPPESNEILTEDLYDQNLVKVEAAYLIKNAIA